MLHAQLERICSTLIGKHAGTTSNGFFRQNLQRSACKYPMACAYLGQFFDQFIPIRLAVKVIHSARTIAIGKPLSGILTQRNRDDFLKFFGHIGPQGMNRRRRRVNDLV